MVSIYTSPLTRFSTLTTYYSDFTLNFLDTTLTGLIDLKQADKSVFEPGSILFVESFFTQTPELKALSDFAQKHQLILKLHEIKTDQKYETNYTLIKNILGDLKGVTVGPEAAPFLPLFLAPHFFCVKQNILETLDDNRIQALYDSDYLYFHPEYKAHIASSKLFGVHECVKSILLLPITETETKLQTLMEKLKIELKHYAYRGCSF